MSNLRLFVAIELPANVLASLNRIQHDLQRDPTLARLRWVRPEGVHLTLKFLGPVPESRRADIEAAVQSAVADIPSFELHLGKLGSFGSKRAPRVLWVDVAGETETLSRLQSQVESELSPLGFPAENKPFAAHLTLARVPPERASEAAAPLAEAVASAEPIGATFRAEELALMKSDLHPGGAVYTQLFAAPLG